MQNAINVLDGLPSHDAMLHQAELDDLPPPEGGIQFGRHAIIRTFNRDGTVTDQSRIWRNGAWHDV